MFGFWLRPDPGLLSKLGNGRHYLKCRLVINSIGLEYRSEIVSVLEIPGDPDFAGSCTEKGFEERTSWKSTKFVIF